MNTNSNVVLLTGATGYIGGRLLRSLEEGGRTVRCLARRPRNVATTKATTEVVQGDCLDEASLDAAMSGVHSAFYLVHSMAAGPHFAELDRRAAANFGRAAARAGVRRIVYLGGLADDIRSLSTHLRSRAETGEALRAGGVPVIELRASIVIGAGSLSFEMIRALVERLPVMICPRWVSTKTQPIAIDDVVAYLAAALDLPESPGRVFEVGGPEAMSYGDIMREYARLRGLRRLLLPVPVLTPHLSGLWLSLVTPAQARVGRALVEGLRNTTVVRSNAARDAFAIQPMSLRAAFVKAMDESAQASSKIDTRTAVVDVPPHQAFAPIRRLGGPAGWYFGNVLWHLRAALDRALGGVGMRRGRRDPEHCAVGDVIDGWTVEAYEPDRRLRLSADMKLPGRGWLEFEVTPVDGGSRSSIRQTAVFDARGLLGRAYWMATLPLHNLLFSGLLRGIVRRAERPQTVMDRPHPSFRREAGQSASMKVPLNSILAVAAVGIAASAGTARTLPLPPPQSGPVQTVASVDLNRYLGDWVEIARLPNRFQRDCAGDVTASYARRADARLDVVNRCRTAGGGVIEARGVARVVDARTSAKLKVRFAPAVLSFLPFVWGDYWILGLADDYSWAVVGSPDREYLWILARTPTMDDGRYELALAAARANGFDLERLTRTDQTPAHDETP